jgi:hypothetical protein
MTNSGNAEESDLLDVEFYIGAAEKHGEDSEPDHEVGDLQEFLRAMWGFLSPEQRLAFATSPEVHQTLDGALAEFASELAKLAARPGAR